MKNIYFTILVATSLILLTHVIKPVNALSAPAPRVSASIHYPDTCNPEFYVNFELSNLGAPSSSESYLSISLSSNLEFIMFHTTPHLQDLMVRIYEIEDPILKASGLPVLAKNKILELYNHSFNSNESVTVSMFFELTLYQSPYESIKYNLVMYQEGTNFPSFSLTLTDPPTASITNQPDYPVYELNIPINNILVESEPEDIDVIPEFPSVIILPLFLTTTLVVTIYRTRMKK